MLRSLSAAALMLTLSACAQPLPHTPPSTVVTAVFDPTTAKIPLPNDLAVPPFNDPNSVCPSGSVAPTGTTRTCAQSELLSGFANGFPNDQEVAITIDFTQTNFDSADKTTQVAPELDLSTFTPSTFFVASTSSANPGEVLLDPIMPGDYTKFSDHGTLTLHHQGHLPWAPGAYAVLLRGGSDGVKTTDMTPVSPSLVFDLLAQGLDMTDPKNIGLLKAQAAAAGAMSPTDAAIAQGMQLNLLIALYKSTAYPVADARFPHQQLAIAATFNIAPAVTNVSVDPARGLAPLPIDLLRDPRAPSTSDPTAGKLTPLAACTLAGSSLAADGSSCATAAATGAAAGFKSLDGFSTTGAILAPTSDLVQVATVTKDTLQLYDLTDPAHPALVPPANLILEPCEFASACGSLTALSPVIAIQPAGATAGDPSSVFRSKPLKDNTDYAVVMTTAIHDKAGNSIGPGTVAKILQFKNPVTVAGKSALVGIDDATATSLEKMRLQLAPVLAAVADPTKVAMAYTFHTQTILSQANLLAALPYSTPAATALPIAATFAASPTVAAAYTKFGGSALPNSNIKEILEVEIVTFNALDPATGAFLADPKNAVAEPIHVLIATPNTTPKTCPAPLSPLKCAPMMIFRHGLGRGRIDMLAIADSFAAQGMVTVAIDAAKHGDRSFCTSGPASATSGCNGGAACTTALPPGAQGDAQPPGTCGAAGFVKKGLDGSFVTDPATQDGIPLVSGNYLVSANFFRTRDTMRQDLIDESQLVRALAFVPDGVTAHAVFDHMKLSGIIIDPATIYFSGQSLGSIQGTMDVATNPRISKAAFNVGGGSIVDIFTNAPAFAAATNQLLAGLGIDKVSNPAGFLQFLTVAKTVLDPADPINFAGHLTDPTKTLPNLLMGGTVLQAPKKILTQIAYCDDTVPNPFNLIHSSNIGVGPLPTGPSFFGGGTGTFQLFVGANFNPATFGASCTPTTLGTVPHGFLLAPGPGAKAQAAIADFVMNDNPQNSVQQ